MPLRVYIYIYRQARWYFFIAACSVHMKRIEYCEDLCWTCAAPSEATQKHQNQLRLLKCSYQRRAAQISTGCENSTYCSRFQSSSSLCCELFFDFGWEVVLLIGHDWTAMCFFSPLFFSVISTTQGTRNQRVALYTAVVPRIEGKITADQYRKCWDLHTNCNRAQLYKIFELVCPCGHFLWFSDSWVAY